MLRAFVLCLSIAASAFAGLEKYPSLVVADSRPRAPRHGEVRVTYLGVNGYQLEAAGHALLVDPYFTRIGLGPIIKSSPIQPDPARVAAGLRHVRGKVDAVLVTHAHFDHLLDSPPIMHRTGAKLIAGPTAVNLARLAGAPHDDCIAVRAGAVRRIGPWTIRVLPAAHDRLFCSVPYPGPEKSPPVRPARPGDWVLGEPLAFIIEAEGQRIYVDSGGVSGVLPPEQIARVDLAIIGVALPDSRRRLADTLHRLRPRYFLPTHQDDFLKPFERGFVFGKLTNFPKVRRIAAAEPLAGRLILLDYFRPWTLR